MRTADHPSRPPRLWVRLTRIGMREWLDIGTAVAELAIARLQLGKRIPLDRFNTDNARDLDPSSLEKVRRVQKAIDRIGGRVPWRSSCLVRALAAQNWLDRSGIKSDLRIGVKVEVDEQLDAHAWLAHGDVLVIGGPVDGYRMLSAVTPRISHGRP